MNKNINITLSSFLIAILTACGSNKEPESQAETSVDAIEKTNEQKKMPDVPVQDKVQVNQNWKLVWQDEFESSEIDLSKWEFEINCYGGGNDEKQCYINVGSKVLLRTKIFSLLFDKFFSFYRCN